MMEPTVRNNEAEGRYELVAEERVIGLADYRVAGDTVIFPHTEIHPELRGRGLGDILVRAALDDVRKSGRTVRPTCSFVRQFIDEHTEYKDLLAA